MADDSNDVVRLFAEEVPEIAAGTVEIKAIARMPGYCSKLALFSRDPRVDCVAVDVEKDVEKVSGPFFGGLFRASTRTQRACQA